MPSRNISHYYICMIQINMEILSVDSIRELLSGLTIMMGKAQRIWYYVVIFSSFLPNYKFERLIEASTHKIVLKCINETNEMSYAVKIFYPNDKGVGILKKMGIDEVAMGKREASFGAPLLDSIPNFDGTFGNRNLIRIYHAEYNEKLNKIFIAEQFFNSLFIDYENGLRNGNRLAIENVIEYSYQIANGLYGLLQMEYVHCDIKWKNIGILANNGNTPRIVITDYGTAQIAKDTDSVNENDNFPNVRLSLKQSS